MKTVNKWFVSYNRVPLSASDNYTNLVITTLAGQSCDKACLGRVATVASL